MNEVILCGRFTREMELRYSQSGQAILTNSIAVDKFVNNERKADFINVVFFGKNAENIHKFCKKGNRILVRGSINTGSYTNKDNVKVYTFDVIVSNFDFIESAQKSDSTEAKNDDFMNIPNNIDEEIPFGN